MYKTHNMPRTAGKCVLHLSVFNPVRKLRKQQTAVKLCNHTHTYGVLCYMLITRVVTNCEELSVLVYFNTYRPVRRVL